MTLRAAAMILMMTASMALAAATAPMLSGCAKRTESSRPAAAPAGEPAAAPAVLSTEDQIREAVFRHLFARNASSIKDRAPVYFLSLAEIGKSQDPSPALMARFAGHRPRVEGVSRSRVTFDEGVRHRDTNERGLIFRVTTINRVSDDLVDVEGGYYEGNVSSSGNTFRVERKAGVWVVTADKMEWIS